MEKKEPPFDIPPGDPFETSREKKEEEVSIEDVTVVILISIIVLYFLIETT